MNLKKIFSTKTALLVLLLLAIVVVVVPVSATITPIFSIPGNTTLAFPSDSISTFSNVNYGPLDIPNSFLNPSEPNLLSGSSTDPKYNLITFNDPISVRSDTVTLPITLYGVHYTAILEKSPVDSLINGMDGYIGTLSGVTNSKVILVVTSDNRITGSIELVDDYIVIKPAERFIPEGTMYPVHVVYSETDLNLPPESYCGVDDSELSDVIRESVHSQYRSGSGVSSVPVDILFVTDTAFYSSSWESKAYNVLIRAYDHLIHTQGSSVNDINIVLINRGYDASKRVDLSQHSQIITDPLIAAKGTFDTTYMSNKRADVIIYLGGYDQYNPNAHKINDINKVGESDYPSDRGRVVWVQVVPDTNIEGSGLYDASEYAQARTMIHELGHIFGAIHCDNYIAYPGNIYKTNVMRFKYEGFDTSGLDYHSSSVSSMLVNRSIVSNYAQ